MVNGWVVIIPGVSCNYPHKCLGGHYFVYKYLGGKCPGDRCLSDKGPRGKCLDC